MYRVLDDDGIQISNNTFKTKKQAKEFITWNFSCLARDGFLEDYTLKEYHNECYIEKFNNNNGVI